MVDDRKREEYRARQERLKRVADNIDRGIGSRFYGADFHLGFNYMFGEIVELQREFNERFSIDMPRDPRFAEFYNRIVQIMESSEIVLIDSIDPNARKKTLGQLVEDSIKMENQSQKTRKRLRNSKLPMTR